MTKDLMLDKVFYPQSSDRQTFVYICILAHKIIIFRLLNSFIILIACQVHINFMTPRVSAIRRVEIDYAPTSTLLYIQASTVLLALMFITAFADVAFESSNV